MIDGVLIAQGAVCVKIPFKNFVISISLDNSCGAAGKHLIRSSLCIFNDDGVNVTEDIFPERSLITTNEIIRVTGDDLFQVFERINKLTEKE